MKFVKNIIDNIKKRSQFETIRRGTCNAMQKQGLCQPPKKVRATWYVQFNQHTKKVRAYMTNGTTTERINLQSIFTDMPDLAEELMEKGAKI